MAASSSYNDGLYTPWSEDTVTSTAAPPAYSVALTTSVSVIYYTPPTSAAKITTTTSESISTWSPTSVWSPSSAITLNVASTTSVWTPSSTVSTSSIAFASIQSTTATKVLISTSSSSATTPTPTTLSRPPVASADAQVSSTSSHGLKLTYLLPVFLLVPVALLLLGLWWLWRQRRRDGESGLGGAGWKSPFSLGRQTDGLLSPSEEGGLVEGRFVDDGYYDEKELRHSPQKTDGVGWYGYLPEPLRRALSKSTTSSGQDSQGVSFRAVPYSNLDAPFIPPAVSRQQQSEERPPEERGWQWGRTTVGITEVDAGVRQPLTSGWKSVARRYRAKSAGSRTSTLRKSAHGSTKSFQRLAEPDSPSVYSPTMENAASAYAGIDIGPEDLDSMLAESRVGHGDRAERYLAGDDDEQIYATTASWPARPYDYEAPDAFRAVATNGNWTELPAPRVSPRKNIAYDLPSAPTPSHVSPTKRHRDVPATSAPVGRDSALSSATLAKPSSRDRLRGVNNTELLPAVPAIPSGYRQQASRDPRLPPVLLPSLVGGPMPDFHPHALRASESAFSLSGAQDLIFGAADGVTPGLRELAKTPRPQSRMEATAQLKSSAPPLPLSLSAPSLVPAPRQTRRTIRSVAPAGGTGLVTAHTGARLPRSSSERLTTFNPEFGSGPELPRLNHPSKVRSAIESLEARTAASGQSPPSPQRLPLPPGPSKLSRSTSAGGPEAIEYDSDQGNIATMLLHRSRTQLVIPYSPSMGTVSDPDSHDHGRRMKGPRPLYTS